MQLTNRSCSMMLWRPNGSRLLAGCTVLFIIVGLVQQGIAQDATLTGDWKHSRDANEQAQRYKAIDQVTEGMNRLMRGRARQMLREKTKPHVSIKLTDNGDRVTMSGPRRRVTFTTDGSPNRVQAEHGAATLRAKRQEGKLVVTSQSQKGVQTTAYSLSRDQAHLILDISVSGNMLKQPVRYRVTYKRVTKESSK